MARRTIEIDLSEDQEQALAARVAVLQQTDPDDTVEAFIGRMAMKHVLQEMAAADRRAVELFHQQALAGVLAIEDRTLRAQAMEAALEAVGEHGPRTERPSARAAAPEHA